MHAYRHSCCLMRHVTQVNEVVQRYQVVRCVLGTVLRYDEAKVTCLSMRAMWCAFEETLLIFFVGGFFRACSFNYTSVVSTMNKNIIPSMVFNMKEEKNVKQIRCCKRHGASSKLIACLQKYIRVYQHFVCCQELFWHVLNRTKKYLFLDRKGNPLSAGAARQAITLSIAFLYKLRILNNTVASSKVYSSNSQVLIIMLQQ